jgi:hypothetical protein
VTISAAVATNISKRYSPTKNAIIGTKLRASFKPGGNFRLGFAVAVGEVIGLFGFQLVRMSGSLGHRRRGHDTRSNMVL